MSDYVSKETFHRSTPVPSDDSDEEEEDKVSNGEDSEECEDENIESTLGDPPEQSTTSEAGLAAANSDFNCHDCPRAELACIRNHISGIQLWSETVSDTKPMEDMLTRLKEIARFLDFLMEPDNDAEWGINDVEDRYLVKTIVEIREEVVGIGLKVKKMEVQHKDEELDLKVLETMVKKFVEEMGERRGAAE
ncbi:hypothetical protein C7212DRAFT_341261 [Tuber magnatum]|uniref:Uncharacterized protein n=1 Tax=Tuber magnatum TaxID=42249 RepID=A0A317T442_9PEZI|nr:hypothetical protein C7212DRAFT_341261 [Tuber magnatum]